MGTQSTLSRRRSSGQSRWFCPWIRRPAFGASGTDETRTKSVLVSSVPEARKAGRKQHRPEIGDQGSGLDVNGSSRLARCCRSRACLAGSESANLISSYWVAPPFVEIHAVTDRVRRSTSLKIWLRRAKWCQGHRCFFWVGGQKSRNSIEQRASTRGVKRWASKRQVGLFCNTH